MKNWDYARLGDISEIGRGSSPRPINDNAYFINGSIPWIKIADATASHKYIFSTKEHVNNYGASFSRRLAPGSLIVAASGTLGFPIFLGVEGCVHDGWLYFKSISGKIDPQYLYYCLKTFVSNFNSISYGAAIQNINTDILRNTLIPVPPQDTQRKIAAILSTYDDLIEVNERRIALLERMAEELYREWFIRMRFPGHDKNRSTAKALPQNWRRTNCYDELDILSGGTPKTDIESNWNGTIPFFTPKDAAADFFVLNTEKHLSQKGLQSCNSILFPTGTIFITARGTVGKLAINAIPMAMNQSCYALVPKSRKFHNFYFLSLKSALSVIKGTANSGVFDNIIVDSFKNYEIVIPTENTMSAFCKIIDPFFRVILKSEQSILSLKATRDRLLSRLLSGALDVEDLDIAFPPSMEEELATDKG
jgi:type I restriction enzyme S subunit